LRFHCGDIAFCIESDNRGGAVIGGHLRESVLLPVWVATSMTRSSRRQRGLTLQRRSGDCYACTRRSASAAISCSDFLTALLQARATCGCRKLRFEWSALADVEEPPRRQPHRLHRKTRRRLRIRADSGGRDLV